VENSVTVATMEPHHPTSGLLFEPKPGIVLRDYQIKTVKKLLHNYFTEPMGGVIVVPCGFGKTMITLCTVGIIGCPFIVLVPSTEIAVQWCLQLLKCFRVGGKQIRPEEIGMVCGRVGREQPSEWRQVTTQTMTADGTEMLVEEGSAVFVTNAKSEVDYWNWTRRQLLNGRSGVLDGGSGVLYVPVKDTPAVKVQMRWLSASKASVSIGNGFTVELSGRELHVFVSPVTNGHYRDILLRQVSTSPEALMKCKVVIASVATITKESNVASKHRQLQALRNRFPLTILDEAHHFAEGLDSSNTFSKAVQLVSSPYGRKWGLTATLLRQDKHAQDVVNEFGSQIHAVEYHENKLAVNIYIDKLTLPPNSTWKSLVQRADNFEKAQIIEALSPVKMVVVMEFLTEALVQGRQGLVFFGRRVVQDVYWQMLKSTGAVRVHGGHESDNDDVQRCTVRERIANYDRKSSQFPNIVFTTNCWETGIDLPEIEFTLFVNEVCEGRRHVVQASGRATRTDPKNPDKQALTCIITTAGTREDTFGKKLLAQLEQSYGAASHCVRTNAPAATNFLLNEHFEGDCTASLDDDAFRRFATQRLQHVHTQIQVSETFSDSCIRKRAKLAWTQYGEWLQTAMLGTDSLQRLWQLTHAAIHARAGKRPMRDQSPSRNIKNKTK
jgi:superfamily II DNA or RNA helicase